MDTTQPYTHNQAPGSQQPKAPGPRLHPLMAAAAISVIVLAGVGITVLLINHSGATLSPHPGAVDQTLATPEESIAMNEPALPEPVAEPEPEPAPAPVAQAPVKPAVSKPKPTYSAPVAKAPAICNECGVVESMNQYKKKGDGSGVGAVAGGVVGGVVGNQIGGGSGKTLATVAGVVGGALAGNEIEKRTKSVTVYEMTVRFEDGTTQVFKRESAFPFSVGSKVKVVDGQVVARDAG